MLYKFNTVASNKLITKLHCKVRDVICAIAIEKAETSIFCEY